jgi:hypothetical protein
MSGPWREPDEDSIGLYPNLVVHDGRVSGSITIGRSRLPLWAIIGEYSLGGWDGVLAGWDYIEADYKFTNRDFAAFLYYLLEQRGEFGRLLLVLADAERCEHRRPGGPAWWQTKRHRKRVADQMRRCLAVLEATP